jgi:hypothetical protein
LVVSRCDSAEGNFDAACVFRPFADDANDVGETLTIRRRFQHQWQIARQCGFIGKRSQGGVKKKVAVKNR